MGQIKIILKKFDEGLHWGLLLLLVLMPYAHGGMIPEVVFLAQAAILLMLAVIFFRDGVLTQRPPGFVSLVFVFFLMLFFSFCFSSQKILAVRALYSYLTPFFFCLVFSHFFSSTDKKNQLSILFVINAVILSVAAVFMHVGILLDFFHGDPATVHGFYANKNHLSGYVEMAALLCFGQILTCRKPTMRISFVLLFLFFVGFIFLIGSRSGTLALCLAVLVVLIFNFYPRGLRRRAVIFWLMSLAVIFSLFIYKIQQQTTELSPTVRMNSGESSWQDRVSLNRSSLKMFRDHWNFGIGIGQYELIYPQYREAGMNRRIDFAHNDILQFVVETGIGGLIFLFLFLFCIFRWTFLGLAFADSRERANLLGSLGALMVIFIHSFFDFNLQIPANAYTAAVILSFLYSAGLMERLFLKKSRMS